MHNPRKRLQPERRINTGTTKRVQTGTEDSKATNFRGNVDTLASNRSIISKLSGTIPKSSVVFG